ncbi:MAG: nitrous oxide reductase family maturation protein NosD, partial [Candidatus Thorarchaeota archaeon]
FTERIKGGLETRIVKIVSNNFVNDKRLIYWQHSVGDTVPIGAGLIILINSSLVSVNNQQVESILVAYCANISIQNNEIFNGTSGIHLTYSTMSFLSENTLCDHKMAGILLEYSQNNTINNNTIANNHEEGILLSTSRDNVLTNNWVTNNSKEGIALKHSENNKLESNFIAYNLDEGIWIWAEEMNCFGTYQCNGPSYGYNILTCNTIIKNNGAGIIIECSGKSTLFNNTISNNEWGIFFQNSGNSNLTNNTINNNNETGIVLGYSQNSTVFGNTIKHNSGRGISLYFSEDCRIMANTIINSSEIGIYLYLYSSRSTITWNKVVKNKDYGIQLTYCCENSTIQHNDFYRNNIKGVSQAYDDGGNNLFSYNHWNDWTYPDNNKDGITDYAYPIDGEASNSDQFPLISPNLSPFEITNTYTGSSIPSLTTVLITSSSSHQESTSRIKKGHRSESISLILTSLVIIVFTIYKRRKKSILFEKSSK